MTLQIDNHNSLGNSRPIIVMSIAHGTWHPTQRALAAEPKEQKKSTRRWSLLTFFHLSSRVQCINPDWLSAHTLDETEQRIHFWTLDVRISGMVGYYNHES